MFRVKRSAFGSVRFPAVALAAAALALMADATASAQSTGQLLPTGVDIPSFVQNTTTALGSIVGVILGAFFGFWVIRQAVAWFRGMGGGGGKS